MHYLSIRPEDITALLAIGHAIEQKRNSMLTMPPEQNAPRLPSASIIE
jgi:hypothetical protein